MNKVLTFFINLFSQKNLLIAILFATVIILVLLKIDGCNSAKANAQHAMQDSIAMQNKLTVALNKAGKLQTSIVAYEGKTSDLDKYSKTLEKQVADLKNRKPSVIIETKIVYVHDTIRLLDSVIDEKNGNYELKWAYKSKDSTELLEGNSQFNAIATFNKTNSSYKLDVTHASTMITKDQLKLDFVVGVAKNTKTGLDEIFVTPQSPNVKVGSLQGAILNAPKKKLYSVSFNLGYGIIYNTNRTIGIGPYFGIGVSRNIFNF